MKNRSITRDSLVEHDGEIEAVSEWVTRQGEFLIRDAYPMHERATETLVVSRLRAGWPLGDAIAMPSSVAQRDLCVREGLPGSWSWNALPYHWDDAARRLVLGSPSGMSADEIAEAIGVSATRVEQIEHTAFGNFRASAARLGFDLRDLLRGLLEARSPDSGTPPKGATGEVTW